jgi:hypothetical protein
MLCLATDTNGFSRIFEAHLLLDIDEYELALGMSIYFSQKNAQTDFVPRRYRKFSKVPRVFCEEEKGETLK